MTNRMNSNTTSVFHFHSKTNLKYVGKPVELKGQLLFCWPYKWEENIDWTLVERLCEDLKIWMVKVNPSQQIDAKMSEKISDLGMASFLYAAYDWVNNAMVDAMAYAKLLTGFKTVVLITILGDCTESNLQTELPARFFLALAKIVFKIFSFELSSAEEMRNQGEYLTIVNTIPLVGHYVNLVFDLSETLKTEFGADTESAQHFSLQLRYFFLSRRIWGEQGNENQVINKSLHQQRRLLTSGLTAAQEMMLLLDGTKVPGIIRENVYWRRCWYLSAFLGARTNDIISLEKELFEFEEFGQRLDNVILFSMETENLTFEQALHQAVREHDDALKEFRDTFQFFQNNPDNLFDLNEEMRKCFFHSLNLLAQFLSRIIQAQVTLKRYLKTIEFKIETSEAL